MTRLFMIGAIFLVVSVFLAVSGCEKEKIVESTEYVHDIEYVELPPDTIMQVDTVFSSDSVTVYSTDTLFQYDTVVQTDYIYDTVIIHDTVSTVITDTVLEAQCTPNEFLALAALQYYSDPLVIEVINQEFGINDGWIFYLSAFQLDLTRQSSDIYDIYGYIDYWTTDWSGFYPFEFFWRMVYGGGDPADPKNWDMIDPPDLASGHHPGLKLSENPAQMKPVRQ